MLVNLCFTEVMAVVSVVGILGIIGVVAFAQWVEENLPTQ